MVRVSPRDPTRYELVFGERPMRACQQAGLKFTAIVASLDDDNGWLYREAENFGRKDKGVLEQALSLKDMPARFGYGEISQVLEKLKISRSHLRRLRAIAEVPVSIWEAIPGAHTTTAREAEMIVVAFKEDPKGVTSRSKKVASDMRRSEAVRFLATGNARASEAASAPGSRIERSGSGLTVRVTTDSPETAQDLEDALKRWLAERGLHEPAKS